tara:strand:- start:1821 stop:3332 length:1512 start_codon:yes stop_codon:yes gene_type:complete
MFLFSSCASLFTSSTQEVTVNIEKNSKVYIDGNQTSVEGNKLTLKRDGKIKQIEIRNDENMDEKYMVIQDVTNPWYVVSWVPFGYFYAIPPLIDLYGTGKAFNYIDSLPLSNNIPRIQKKGINDKSIFLNNVEVNLPKDSLILFSFNRFKGFFYGFDKYSYVQKIEADKGISLANTKYSSSLNKILLKNKYLDNSNKVLGESYSKNISINSTIFKLRLNRFKYRRDYLFQLEIGIKWEVLDFYEKPISTDVIYVKSNQFASKDPTMSYLEFDNAVENVIERNFSKFIYLKSTQEFLKYDTAQVKSEEFSELQMISSFKKVKSLTNAVEACVTVKSVDGHGSGFVISEDGYVITNYHVIANSMTGGELFLNDGEIIPFKVVRVSKIHDLALLKMNKHNLVPFDFTELEKPVISESIYCIGTPTAENLGQTISRGIVSGYRKFQNYELIQTDASISPGNSGGPLVTKKGKVLGVVTSKLVGFGVEGLSFCIPITKAIEVFNLKFL